ncbi:MULTISPECIES: hypothetical protein [Arthrobacter]|uniref:DNA binding domain-containing protein, excisionase family n=2 Tax=Arthrobacter TaxID=1663 RepID=A0ABU9KHJ3_9MICC|nr:hypothetical protein [Arthrobacter sp. YJM1]MDP5226638.1 hypothetical protein [Arthrobacter sp. YJM1]
MADESGLTLRPYRVAEFAKIAGMPEARIYLAIKEGQLKALTVGRNLYLPREKSLQWLRGEA